MKHQKKETIFFLKQTEGGALNGLDIIAIN